MLWKKEIRLLNWSSVGVRHNCRPVEAMKKGNIIGSNGSKRGWYWNQMKWKKNDEKKDVIRVLFSSSKGIMFSPVYLYCEKKKRMRRRVLIHAIWRRWEEQEVGTEKKKGKHGQKKDRQWNERMNRQELLRILLWEWKGRNDDDDEKQNEVTDACPRPSNLTSYEKRWEGGEKNVLWGSTSVLNIIRVGKRTLDNFEETRITCSKKYMDKKKVTTKTRHATLQN